MDLPDTRAGRRQRRALEVSVVALLIAGVGFAVAYLGHQLIGWWIIALAAAANLASGIAFFLFKWFDVER